MEQAEIPKPHRVVDEVNDPGRPVFSRYSWHQLARALVLQASEALDTVIGRAVIPRQPFQDGSGQILALKSVNTAFVGFHVLRTFFTGNVFWH